MNGRRGNRRNAGLRKWVVAAVMVAGCCGQGLAAAKQAGQAGEAERAGQAERVKSLVKLTEGARAKVVWIRAKTAPDLDGVLGDAYELVVFDTAEAKERVLVRGPGSCSNPHITADGKTVVFTDLDKVICYAVDWSGANLRQIAKGTNAFVMCTWQDPDTGINWVYVGDCYNPKPKTLTNPANNEYDVDIGSTYEIYRHRLDKPSVRELVWGKERNIKINHRFSISADGTRAGSEFPWPQCGEATLADGKITTFAKGCHSCIAPDNSYMFFIYRGDHKALRLFDGNGGSERVIDVSQMPGANSAYGCWAPKWSSDVRFLTHQEMNGNIYLGRFDENFTKVEGWAQVNSTAGHQNTQGYAWIDKPRPGKKKPMGKAAAPAVKVRDKSPAAMAALKAKTHVELSGQLVAKTATPDPASIAPYRRALVVYEYAVDQVTRGQYAKQKIRIARWGIEDRKVTPVAGEAIGTPGKFVLESMAAYPNLESEYLADTLDPNPELDVYVEVGWGNSPRAGAPAAAGKAHPPMAR